MLLVLWLLRWIKPYGPNTWMEDKNMFCNFTNFYWDFGMSDWDQVKFIGKSLG